MRNSFANALRSCALAAGFGMCLVASAQAQSRAPFGVWQGERSGGYLWINRDGSCSGGNLVNIAGRCEWLPNKEKTGGMLHIFYSPVIPPGRVGWSVLWLNRNTLLINGVERFFRRQG